jgi:hypothetical protein
MAPVFAHDLIGDHTDVLAHATTTVGHRDDVSALDFAGYHADVLARDFSCDHQSRLESPALEVFDGRLAAG